MNTTCPERTSCVTARLVCRVPLSFGTSDKVPPGHCTIGKHSSKSEWHLGDHTQNEHLLEMHHSVDGIAFNT